jgi:hypothetical protein
MSPQKPLRTVASSLQILGDFKTALVLAVSLEANSFHRTAT